MGQWQRVMQPRAQSQGKQPLLNWPIVFSLAIEATAAVGCLGWRAVSFALIGGWAIAPAALAQDTPGSPLPPRQPLTVVSDVQEANNQTGVVTARGNVQVDYPARQIRASAAQAQYFSNERRLVMAGDVYVQQEGNSLRAETVTYFIDEARTIALPRPGRQVEAIYLVQDTVAPLQPGALAPVPLPADLVVPESGDRPKGSDSLLNPDLQPQLMPWQPTKPNN